jgi:carotenoid phi-ring synthase / carotenoid chi-ring synthase
VELHAYAIPPEQQASPDALAQRLIADMHRLIPELSDAQVLHQEMQLQDNFTRFGVGDHRRRPGTKTKVDGLFLAGDWVKIDAPVALMEGAVVSGVVAANAIVDELDAGKVQAHTIQTVLPTGPLR